MKRALACMMVGAQVLCACTALVPAPTVERQYVGRFSVVAMMGGKTDSGSGRFTFTIEGPGAVLDLASPLGSTLARIEVDPRGARLTAPTDSGQREVRGASAEALTYEVLGWPLPVAGFRDWIEGRPVPSRPSTQLRTDGDDAFEQDGWTISVLERFEGNSTAPRRLLFERAETREPAPAISLRLVLDEPPFVRQGAGT
ncbi:MAG TPA: outer membrane lipoprotein LolB [Burkholderiaceae bacterium]|nr:outer membrane lipoprotein LolB [Burkholderiaceae bacterium]